MKISFLQELKDKGFKIPNNVLSYHLNNSLESKWLTSGTGDMSKVSYF